MSLSAKNSIRMLSFVAILAVAPLAMAAPEVIGDLFSFSQSGWLSDQWQKLKVQANVRADVDLGSHATARAKYEYRVEPAFVKSAHQRQDSWLTEIEGNTASLTTSNGTPFGVGGKIGAQVVFSRLFESKAKALKEVPYWLDRIPWNSDKAMTLLGEGDAVRIETFLDLSAGVSTSSALSQWTLGASFAYQRGTRFLTDIYRLKNNHVRVRMLGQRNDGTNSFGLDFSPTDKFDFGTGVIKRLTDKWLNCSLVNIDHTGSSFENPPVDTLMVDFVFDLNNSDARQAYDLMMDQLAHVKFRDILNPKLIFVSDRSVTNFVFQEIRRISSSVEKITNADKELPVSLRRIDRLFKGKTRSAIGGNVVRSRCLYLWDIKGYTTQSATLVESSNSNEQLSYQILEGTHVGSERSAAGSMWETNNRGTMTALFNADKNFNSMGMTDVILNREREDKSFRESELKDLKDYLQFTLPAKTYSSIDWSAFESSGGTKTNVSLQYYMVLRADAFGVMPQLNTRQAYTALYQYVEKYPDRDWLNFTASPFQEDGSRRSDSMDKFDYDLQNASVELAKMLNFRAQPKDRLVAFRNLRSNILFQQVGPGFLISLLPKDKADGLVAFQINLNGSDHLNVSYRNSRNAISNTYTAAQFITDLIQNRSFDLKLQINESGQIPNQQ